jgi:glutamate/tyrosine decarboxylase-like PLP-dependent enzyme
MTENDDKRDAALNLSADEFRELGHALIDKLADFFSSISERQVTPAHTPKQIRSLLGTGGLPEHGMPAEDLLSETAELLFNHSLHIGHPRFLGYITSSAAPIGALGDLLASSVNSNVGGWDLAPMASEIEAQTVRWLAEFIHYPEGCGGLMVSGGNMANIVGFLAGRQAKAPWDIRARGLYADQRRMTVYASRETHTWLQKAADISGIGTDNIRWIATDEQQRMDLSDLRQKIETDEADGRRPFLVVGTAGTVSTGTVDPLQEITEICSEHDLWFHVDGAYGALGAALPGASADLMGISRADSLALDPHKWLYSPLEAGCVLVKDPEHLTDAFRYTPEYYHFPEDPGDPKINYYEYGVQNSRGFRALKVWLGLRSVGREGYVQMLEDDIALSKRLYAAATQHIGIEAVTQKLSITTFRYKPADLDVTDESVATYLNNLNEKLLTQLNDSGEAFLSNAVVDGMNLLRACVVNFRTTDRDIDAIPEIVFRHGSELDAELRPANLKR